MEMSNSIVKRVASLQAAGRARACAVFLLLATAAVTAAEPQTETAALAGPDVRFLDLQSTMSAGWQAVTPSSSMRLAQFSIRDAERGGEAETIFYYFGRGQGGSIDNNVARWRSQFRDDRGQMPEAGIRRFDVAGMAVTVAHIQGRYARGIGAGPGGEGKPGQTLLAALVETHAGTVIIQLHGDTPLVDDLEPGFIAMLKAIRRPA